MVQTNKHPLHTAVIRQLGGGKDAISSAKDAARHGADGGFAGFTYYSDTQAFTARHRAAIAACVEEMAIDLGEDPIKLVQGFGCFRNDQPSGKAVALALYGGNAKDEDRQNVENALAWFALEEVGRRLLDEEEA
jgi:hypothetical protein